MQSNVVRDPCLQDWEHVVLRKPKTMVEIHREQTQYAPGHKKYLNLISNEPEPPKRVSARLSMQIRNARLAKGWSQKDLASKCSLRVSVIADYESGKTIPVPKDLNILSKVLCVKLVRN
jgi:ribosome-binding protein aMBF1 (putative translation factor)